MIQFTYLFLLVATILCFGLIDRRWKLAFFYQPRRALLTTMLCTAVFIAWDVIGISLGVFFEGDSPYDTGLFVLPHMPVEELFFLFSLIYMSLVLYRAGERIWPRTS